LGAAGLLFFYVLFVLSDTVIPDLLSLVLSVAAAAALIILLVKYPEWYVIDTCGIIMGVGAIATFGISLGILLTIVLLIGMAAYDAISVYWTKHMIDIADIMLRLRLPVMLVVPKIRGYSLIRETRGLKERLKEDEGRDAFFMGLGDIIIPGILVASIFYNITSNGLTMALSVILGTLLGFALVMLSVVKGRPQAGLPYLCGGALLGYIISSYLLFGGLVGL
jgi:presenilin-like A22 family membrane protease